MQARRLDQEMIFHPCQAGRVGLGHYRSVMDTLPTSAASAGEMPRTPSNEAPAKPAVARSMSRRFAGMSVIESSCRALDVKTASSLFNR
jgi:hypothetical protein